MQLSVRYVTSSLNTRGRVRYRPARLAFAVIATAVLVAAFAALLWHAEWFDGNLRGLTPDERVTALDDARGRLMQLGAGVLAAGALVFTALNFRLSREGHVTDRYTKAIEQLGSERLDVRLGAIYALERIMLDSARDHPTIVEVLAAFVREHSSLLPDTAEQAQADTTPLATDVRAALTVLTRRPMGRWEQGLLDLQRTRLAGIYLLDADLNSANLAGADLTGAVLFHARLANANLSEANLTGVILSGSNLTGARLAGANLTQAHLDRALLPPKGWNGTDLTGTSMACTDLAGANLVGANLTGANLRGANLLRAELGDAVLTEADLTGAIQVPTNLTVEQEHSAKGPWITFGNE